MREAGDFYRRLDCILFCQDSKVPKSRVAGCQMRCKQLAGMEVSGLAGMAKAWCRQDGKSGDFKIETS